MRNFTDDIDNISCVNDKSSMMHHFQDEDLKYQVEDLREKNARLEKQYLQGLMEVQSALLYAQESSANLKLQTQRVEQLESELKKNKINTSSKQYSASRSSHKDYSYESFKNQSQQKQLTSSDWKVSLIQSQNQEFRQQIKELQKENQKIEDEKKEILLDLQSKDDEINLLKNKYENLEHLYQTQTDKVDELFREAENYLLQEQDQKEKALQELNYLQQEYQNLQLAFEQSQKDKQMYLDGIQQKDTQILQLQEQFNENIYRLQSDNQNDDIYQEFDYLKSKLQESDQQQQELQDQMNQCIEKHYNEQYQMNQQIDLLEEQLTQIQYKNQNWEQQNNDLTQLLQEKDKDITILRQKLKEMNDDKIQFMLGINKELQEIFKKFKDGDKLSKEVIQKTIDSSSLTKKFSMDMCSVTYNLSSHDKHEFSIKKVDPNKSLSTFQFTSECKGNNFASASFRMKESDRKDSIKKIEEFKPQLFNTESFSSCSSVSSHREKAFSDLLSKTQDAMYQTLCPNRSNMVVIKENEQNSEFLQRNLSGKENLNYSCRIDFNK